MNNLRRLVMLVVLLGMMAAFRPNLPTLSAAPDSDNNLLWDWLYHAPDSGNPATQPVPGQSENFLNVNGTTVTIYALTDQNDATMARVRLWEGSERFVSMSKAGTATWNSRTVDVWKATITNAITSGPTWYHIHVQDGTHNAYLKKNNGGQAGGYTNPHGQFLRGDTTVADGDYSYTASAGPVNTVTAPAVSAALDSSGSFNVTLANSEAISGGSIVLEYDATRGVTLSGHPVSGSGSATRLTIPVGNVAAGAGASWSVGYSVSENATTGSFALTIAAQTSLTGSSNTVLASGSFNVSSGGGGSAATDVYVQLFEWLWNDIAKECTFLAAKGYKGVLISPPNEHIVPPATNSYSWWARYQPVSYSLAQSRSGTQAEFEAMITTCSAAGVDILADMVVNHMANWADSGVGTAGNSYSAVTLNYPATPFTNSNFFHQYADGTGAFGNCKIQGGDYSSDPWRVRNCSLENLPDLKTEDQNVRQVIANYMNTLIGMGVKGFRVDAAKHMEPADLTAIRSLLSDQSVFIFAEVIDNGGEPITAGQYLDIGYVTEFKYQTAMGSAFSPAGGCGGPNLSWLANIANGKLPSANAVVFTNNHDSQRGHGASGPCVLNYRNGDPLYNLAQVFMLAHPYGRPIVMSSYHWDGFNDSAGPPTVNGPAGSSGATKPVYGAGQNAGDTPQFCDGTNWVCEHRRQSHTGMVGFRNTATGQAVTNWWDNGGNKIAFGRNGTAFVSLNRDSGGHTRTYATGLPAGQYCDVVHGDLAPGGTSCTGPVITVDGSGNANFAVNGMDAVAMHINARIGTSDPLPVVTITEPTSGAILTTSFTLAATASVSGSTITNVQFFVDNVLIATDTTAPYSVTIDPTAYPSGTRALKATATAASGTSNSHTINVTFDPPVPPSVTITHPDDGAIVSGTFPITATATHFSGIQRVDFYVDGVLVGSDNTPSAGQSRAAAPHSIPVVIDGNANEWTSAQLIATSPAHNSAQVAAPCLSGPHCNNGHTWSTHERQVDFIALYATWDAQNIYFGVQAADVIDVVDPANANSGDPTYTWDGGLMFIAIDSGPGGYSTGGDMWNKPQTFVGNNLPNYQVYFSHTFWQGGPFVRGYSGGAWGATAPATGQTHASVGLAGASSASFVAGTPVVGNHNGNPNFNFVANGHNTGRNGFYELKVPLGLIGNPDLNNGCIEVLVANSHSAIDSIPKDPTTLDTPGVSDSNSPLEWSDTDAFSVPFLKIGNGSECGQASVGNEYSITLNAADYAPGVHDIEARAIANNGLEGSDFSTFVIEGQPTGLTLAVGQYEVAAGGTFDAVLAISDNPAPGIGALNVELTYDPAVLQLVSCTPDPTGLFTAKLCNEAYSPQSVRMNFVAVSGVAGNLTLATVRFQAVGAAGSSSPLSLTVHTSSNPAGNPISVTRMNGLATVTSGVLTGDVNCDGQVNAIDALFIAQYDVGLRSGQNSCPIPANTIFLPACDVNNDGQCNVIDQLFIMQCDIGGNNLFCPAGVIAPSRHGKLVPASTQPQVSQSADLHLTIDHRTIAPGQTVTIPVRATVRDGQNLGAINTTLMYDSRLLTVTGCAGAPGIDSALCNTGVPGQIRMNALALAGRSGSFDVWQITFRMADGATGQSPVSFAAVNVASDAAGNSLTSQTEDGLLCAGTCQAPTAIPLAGGISADSATTLLPVLALLVLTVLLTFALLIVRQRRA